MQQVFNVDVRVSTHSRPKAAAIDIFPRRYWYGRFQHTAARRRLQAHELNLDTLIWVSTHSRPKAAAAFTDSFLIASRVSTHSRPKAAALLAA